MKSSFFDIFEEFSEDENSNNENKDYIDEKDLVKDFTKLFKIPKYLETVLIFLILLVHFYFSINFIQRSNL